MAVLWPDEVGDYIFWGNSPDDQRIFLFAEARIIRTVAKE